MQLIVITQETFFPNEAETINKLFAANLQILHLRKPNAARMEIRTLLENISSEYHNRIVLHDHFDLLNDFKLKGVHLNRRNPIPPHKKNISISKSCHSLQEVKECTGKFDYVFLSPIFDSISKSGYRQAYSSEELIKAKSGKIIYDNVIALGGITIDNISKVKDWGFGGVAVLGSIWGKPLQTSKPPEFPEGGLTEAIINRFLSFKQKIEEINNDKNK